MKDRDYLLGFLTIIIMGMMLFCTYFVGNRLNELIDLCTPYQEEEITPVMDYSPEEPDFMVV